MAKAQFSEKQLQDWIYRRLGDGTLASSIANLDESLQIARAYLKDPFVSDLNGFLFSMAKLRWAEGVERIADWHSPVREVSVARTGGRPLQIDILGRTTEFGGFVIVELKRDRDTERQAVTELAAYANALSNIFPTLPPQRTSLAVIAADWNNLLVNALTLFLVFHRYNIVGLKPILDTGSSELSFKLRIVDFVALGDTKPRVIDTDSMDYLHLEIDPEELPPLMVLEEITRYIRRLDLNGFCTVLGKDESAAVCALIMNPYKLTESYLDSVDMEFLASVLGLSDGWGETEVLEKLSELAISWTNQLVEVFEPFRSMAAKIGEIELPRAQIKGTLQDFLQKDYRAWSIGYIQFAGIFEDFANAWRASPTALDLLRGWVGEIPARKKLLFLFGMPEINLFVLSEFAGIGEFRYGLVSLLDIFRFGRRLGRLENCALFDTEEQYDRERQVFLISLTRCPFRVQINLTSKSTLLESCQAVVEAMYRKIVESSYSLPAELFMLGYLAESQYDSMVYSKRGTFEAIYIVTDLDSWIDQVLRTEKDPELRPLISYLWERREKAVNPKSANELSEFLSGLEYIIEKVDERLPVPWVYEEKAATLSYEMRQIARRLLGRHAATIKYPLMGLHPNGDLHVVNSDRFFEESEDMRNLWESLDHDIEFLLIDEGQGLGTFWAISYEEPSNDRVLKTFKEQKESLD